MKYLPIENELFKLNRRRFTQQMAPNTIAIFHSNDLMPRNGDGFFPFRQNSQLFYLSGLDQEETVVVLFPDCIKDGFREVAFIKRTDEYIRRWEGYKYTKEEARKISGIAKIFWLDEMETILRELILLSDGVYLNINEHDRFETEVPSKDLRFARHLRDQYPLHQLYRAQPILRNLAMQKSEWEVGLIGQAIDITAKAFNRVLETTRPGLWEFEVEAEITAAFLKNRASGHAYTPIVASGANSCVLHYIDNNRQCKDGAVLLLDFGAEYANYAADMTRTIPVNGQFSPRQKAVYEAVLRVMRGAIPMLVPGMMLEEYHKEVGKRMEAELIQLGLLDKTDVKNQDPLYPAYKKYFMHGTSHHLGL
ncbi:MAG: aminopeptidase P N-terminal domain-containing protein, partial [Phaeodactylibacter sp.]|nr:aminopeptidase P N-terminal domain-containing protein [Phaeodactylibacter sp.]